MDLNQIHTLETGISFLITILGWVYSYGRLSSRIDKLETMVELLNETMRGLHEKSAQSHIDLNDRISSVRTESSRTYATLSALEKIEERYLNILTDIRGEIKGISSRIDRVLERGV